MNPLEKQEHIGDHVRTLLPKFWADSKHHLKRMWHFFFWDKTSEVVMIPIDDKDIEAEIVKDYCQARKPSAILMITEAWMYIPPKELVAVTDLKRLNSDPAYYADFKTKCKRVERLMATAETNIGMTLFSWDIVREDGKDPCLSNFEENSMPKGASHGRFENLLTPYKPSENN